MSYEGASLCFLSRSSVFSFSSYFSSALRAPRDSPCPALLGYNSSFPELKFKRLPLLRRGIPGLLTGQNWGRMMQYSMSYEGASLCFLSRSSVFSFSSGCLSSLSGLLDSPCPALLGYNSSFPEPKFKRLPLLRRGIQGQLTGKVSSRMLQYLRF